MSIQAEINRINNEVEIQSSLISQIATALENKAAGSTANTIYIGTTDPTADVGADGDIYIVRS